LGRVAEFRPRLCSSQPSWLGMSMAAAFCDGFNAVSAPQILRS
jgi:hypothetical protein